MTVLRPRHRRGGVHSQTGSISITAAPETVWELVTTVDAICEWYDTWDAVEHDGDADARLQVGSAFRLIRHGRGGRDHTAHCQVTEVAAPTRLRWKQTAPHTPTTSVVFVLAPGALDGTTELRHTRTWEEP